VPIPIILASFFSALFNAILQEQYFSKVINDLTLTRFNLFYTFDLWTQGVTQLEEEYSRAETGKPDISFQLRFSVARKLASDLTARLLKQTAKVGLVPEVAPPLEAAITAEAAKRKLETIGEIMIHHVAELQTELASKLEPSTKNMYPILLELEKQAIPITSLVAMAKPAIVVPTSSESLFTYRFAATKGEETVEAGLLGHPSTEATQTPSPTPVRETTTEAVPSRVAAGTRLSIETEKSVGGDVKMPAAVMDYQKQMLAEIMPLGLTSGVKLNAEASKALGYAVKMPSTVLEYQKQMLAETIPSGLTSGVKLNPEASKALDNAVMMPTAISVQQKPFLKIASILSRAFSVPTTVSSPSIQQPYYYPEKVSETLTPMPSSQISLLLKEISPPLASWIYQESEVLRSTGIHLSAVPVAASSAERVITETLIQPISSLEPPHIYGSHERVSQSVAPHSPAIGAKPKQVEAFRVPSILTSLVASYAQTYPMPSLEPAAVEIYETIFETERTHSTFAKPSKITEEQRLHRLPTVLALAGAESLIAQRLQRELGAFMKEVQTSQSAYAETLAELSTSGPISTGMSSGLVPTAASLAAIESYAPSSQPVSAPTYKPSPVNPPIQHAINLTVSTDTSEEDLRELERKINRILSEQVSRYYGSSRI
jgi:hypothetical protein